MNIPGDEKRGEISSRAIMRQDDWRARVRGLERVASALRTSSALIAIESRLGSLLHAVLGCERSCRVAAAGLAVAKVVVAGVNEDALRKRLPQLAWGLARQGGASAAQLARITMLRLRPTLLLEQLLQPQCLSARNAKTRENALQLLIFSLVTFPSTEFKMETVANKVSAIVADRRRRVRQAALDTLAVLAQIYESEEVLTAGRRAAEGRHDGEAMVSAIRARLARKSLPMVSADGLVVYGLQISPTMQIATGPDVDWIVAGSGSVSPGTGRVRGQIIATTKSEKKKFSRNATTKIRESSWNERPDFVARGVGLQSKTEKPVAWQIVPTENQDDIHLDDELGAREDRNVATDIYNGKNSDLSVKSKDESRSSCESGAELTNYRDTVKSNERKAIHGIVDGVSKKKESFNLKPESKIPVLFSRDRTTGMKTSGTAGDKSGNVDAINSNSRRRTKDIPENSNGRLRSREDATGSYAVMYQRRKRLQQESASNVTSAVHDVNPSIDSQYGAHRSASSAKSSSNAAYANVTEGPNQSFSEITSQNSQKFIAGRRSSGSSNSKSRESGTSTTEGGQRPVLINLPRQAHPVYKLYSAVYRPHGRFADESSFRALQTAPAPLSRVYCQDYDRHTAEDEDRILLNPLHAKMDARTKDVSAQKVSEVELRSSEAQTNERFVLENRKESPCRRRLRSLSPSQLYHLRQHVRLATDDFHTMSMYDIYCAWPSTAKEEDNEHVAKKADVKHVAKKSDSKHVVKEDYDNRVINEEYDNHVIKEDDDNHVIKEEYGSRVIKDDDENRTTTKSDNNYLTRKSYKNHAVQEDDDKYVLQEDDYEHVAKSIEEKSEFWLAGTALRCCPCVFRCRRPVGVEKENEKTPSTTVTTANTTPVIALRLNQSTDTIDKTAVNEEEYNEKNKRHFLPELSSYRAQALDPRFDVDDHERSFSKSTSSSSSDISRGNDQYKDQGVHAEGIYSNSNSRSSTPHIQDPNTAFDVITQQSNSRGRDTVDSYMPLDGKELGLPLVSSNFSLDDDASKDWSSEEDIKLENRVDSKSSDRSEFLYGNEHLNSVGLDISERIESERSDAGALPNSDLLYSSRSPSRNSNQFAASRSSSRSNSRSSIHKLALEQNQDLQTDSSEERMISSTLPDENGSFQSLDNLAFRRGSNAAESPTIVIASRPHSTEAKDFMTNTIDVISNVVLHKENIHEALQSTEESSVNDILEEVHSKDSASETNTEPGILKIEQAHPMEPVNPQRKISKVPRSTGRLRANTKGNSGHSTEKSKPIVQQCFAQLENKDWEVTMKGLKVLSQIAKQNPEYLDVCTAGTIGRLLGRHIRNLRSQVARTACLAAGDIFSSRIRGIDQDIDDIAGPLLHRTADTNRFLRADSNAALDRMIEHLPPHRTIGVIVQRGGNHQNAIVRAATARLLSEVVDRVGPEHAMILPRDVKDKLLNAGAKLLMDGNLDARNHAKKMFRRLTRCEGFRRALTDAVPETTLRHIDKTLKSL
ncbi:hypothetical protein KM043_013808 [Ampulex compressa]|nr:hypothetical protein KM043_013808 [Ampulex compressa]